MNCNYEKSYGFSFVEILTIIILLGILTAVAISRLDITPFRTAGFEQELRSAIRFAQKFAIASGCDVQVSISAAADSYALALRNDAVASSSACLTAVAAFGTALPDPAGQGGVAGVAPAGVDVLNDLVFFYDRLGRPSIAGGTVTLNTSNIVIENITGFVY